MKSIITFLTLISLPAFTFAQESAIVDDTVELKLTLLGFDGKKIESTVNFENMNTHTIITFKTNKEGKANCKLPIAETYSVKIPGSTDSYEYTIPDFAASPTEISFKFHSNISTEKTKRIIGINVLNGNDPKTIALKRGDEIQSGFSIKKDTVYFEIEQKEQYTLIAKDVIIRNNTIVPDSSNNVNYILFFYDTQNAELMPINTTQSVININYTNLHDKPIKNEPIFINAEHSGHTYAITTSSTGTAIAIVPQNDHYSISLKYFPNVFELDIRPDSKKNVILSNTVNLKFPSTREYENQKREDSLSIAIRDSLYWKYSKPKELTAKSLEEELKDLIVHDRELINTDSAYFQKKENTVCSVLQRNKNTWNSKAIVTDVTGSMYPYMKEVALWHLLEATDQKKSNYIFFNDGDNKPDGPIGKTGGIYYSMNNDVDSMITIMYKAMRNGKGGDFPENDIEAILSAAKVTPPGTELILIADNLSPVRDLTLLSSVTIPVRVILCGSAYNRINSDYLTIAYRTKGSLHTIEEDICNLFLLRNNEKIIIGGVTYIFSGGRFFPLEKKL